ncbi:hypothetical protein GCM10010398_18770 [Streptomyces fimbriatus]
MSSASHGTHAGVRRRWGEPLDENPPGVLEMRLQRLPHQDGPGGGTAPPDGRAGRPLTDAARGGHPAGPSARQEAVPPALRISRWSTFTVVT